MVTQCIGHPPDLDAVDSEPLPGHDALGRLTDDFMAGYLSGYIAGIDRGREQLAAEQDALHRRAVRIVHGMAKADPWPEHVANVRQRQIEAARRWSE